MYHRFNGGFRTLSPGTLEVIERAFELARQRDGDVGDYLEFGLFRGRTFWHAFETCRRLDIRDTRFYGFDSFCGLPSVDKQDSAGGRFFEGQFAARRSEVEKNLSRHGLDWSRARLVEGFFEDTLTEKLKSDLPRRRAAVVLLDCDLYASTVVALHWLEDVLVDGAIVLFDDWSSYGEDRQIGQQRALAEFLAEHPRWKAQTLWRFDRHGKGFRLTLRHGQE
jgi:hypothetical protein